MRDEIDELAERWVAAGMSPQAVARLELSKRISRIALVLEQGLRTELADLGLTYAEFDVLAALHRSAPPHRMKPSALSRSLMLTSGGTSNVLQRLTTSGYVTREPDPDDARSRLVALTEDGIAIADKAVAASARLHEELLAGLPDKTVRHAADALREVVIAIGRRRYR